jgi:hypothetical protein
MQICKQLKNKICSLKLLGVSLFLIGITQLHSAPTKKKKQKKEIIYEYRKFEEFDFESLDISGNVEAPGDVSVQQRYKKSFKNKIPERKEFNRMLENSIDTLK